MLRDDRVSGLIHTSGGNDEPALVVPQIPSRIEIDPVLLCIGDRFFLIELKIHKGIEMDLTPEIKRKLEIGISPATTGRLQKQAGRWR